MPQGPAGGSDTATARTTIYHHAATLTVLAPPSAAGRTVAVDPGGTVIGRDASSQLALPGGHISRRHAIVRPLDGEYVIEDFGSTNGTRVNGEAVTGVQVLQDGDRLSFADVEIEFRLGDPVPAPDLPLRRSLRHQLHRAPGFSGTALLVAVCGSVVGTVLTGALGSGQWGTLAGAAIGPVVSTAFSTKRTGEKGRVRGAAIAILSLAALLITWVGVSVTDAAAGTSVIPGTDHRSSTFPGDVTVDGGAQPTETVPAGTGTKPATTPPAPTRTAAAQINAVRCGSLAVASVGFCPSGTITYRGKDRLHITDVEVVGRDADDFTPDRDCVDTWLGPGGTCQIVIQFHPSLAGERHATLIVHQNLPRPDRGTRAQLTGTGTGTGTGTDNGTDSGANTGAGAGGTPDPDTCRTGFVWRDAFAGDHVCVTPDIRDQARADNALAAARRDPAGGPYGPDTCLDGFVWREAVPSDHVCVTPPTRTQTMTDNQLASSRRIG
jgi:hypothetical protein